MSPRRNDQAPPGPGTESTQLGEALGEEVATSALSVENASVPTEAQPCVVYEWRLSMAG